MTSDVEVQKLQKRGDDLGPDGLTTRRPSWRLAWGLPWCYRPLPPRAVPSAALAELGAPTWTSIPFSALSGDREPLGRPGSLGVLGRQATWLGGGWLLCPRPSPQGV